jgi:hypothetical protein
VRTAHHPQTGATRMEFDALEMIRRLCAQIPDARQHMTLYYGWYSHRYGDAVLCRCQRLGRCRHRHDCQ